MTQRASRPGEGRVPSFGNLSDAVQKKLMPGILGPGLRRDDVSLVAWLDVTQLFRASFFGSSMNTAGVPFLTFLPSKSASQLVRRTQPWDSDLLTLEGSAVPWMP